MRRHHGRAPSPYAGRTAAPPSAEVTLVRNFDQIANPTRPVRQSPLATSQIQGMPLDLIERVRSFPLFQNAPETFLSEIGMLLKPQMHSPNEYIMVEGDDAKAMYWIVRGAVEITSRDGESTYAELKSGAMVGEIGILLDRPRTATVVARTRCLTLQLKKEDLRKILPAYPEVERAIREEALERLSILDKKKKQRLGVATLTERRGSKRPLDAVGEEMEVDDSTGKPAGGSSKRRKSPSPGLGDISIASPLGNGLVNVRTLLEELPLFASLPPDMLHFLGLNAQPQAFPPFTDIIKQDTTGREVFFIVRGEVEVIDERPLAVRKNSQRDDVPPTPLVKARLKGGQYFGEVVSLSLADHRTATVRSVTQVECLVITENVLTEFWNACPIDVKEKIANTAKRRLETASSNDVCMQDADATPDIDDLVIGEDKRGKVIKQKGPRVAFNDPEVSRLREPAQGDPSAELKPLDPDPFKSVGLENVRLRSRRSSLAPPSPDEPVQSHLNRRSPMGSPGNSPAASPGTSRSSRSGESSPVAEVKLPPFSFSDPFAPLALPPIRDQSKFDDNQGSIPDQFLPLIFDYLELHELMALQAVSKHWRDTLTKSPLLFHKLDLSRYNHKLTDSILINRICPFIGPRPRTIDISNCFHLTDQGFSALAAMCGSNVQVWRMKSVWDVTAPAILDMSNRARGLTEIDLSNCRKVSDTLLARIIGWVVPSYPSNLGASFTSLNAKAMHKRNRSASSSQSRLGSSSDHSNSKLQQVQTNGVVSPPAPGTIYGCPDLRSITLSYCKHITDRTMHHIASHAASRVESMDLTRCTTITDMGFQYWGNVRFERLQRLCLADCTYLSDQAMVWLVNGAGQSLRDLDLSFCCALSDTSTEVLALGCPNLHALNLSFCGSAVSDSSLRSIGHHLSQLEDLAVRGCVRVTGVGVESVVEGCIKLKDFDVSQCKNLAPWFEVGGIERIKQRGRNVRFETVKENKTSG